MNVLLVFLALAGLGVSPETPRDTDEILSSSGDQGGETLALDAAITRALDANLGVERSRSAVVVADIGVRLALAERRPRFSLDGQGVYNIPKVEIPFGDDLVVRLLPEFDWQTQIRVTQPLYTGGRLARVQEQARVNARRARDGLHVAEEALVLRVVTSYLGVVRGDALIAVEKQSVEIAQRWLRRSEIFYEAGEVTRVDVLRARASIKGAERRMASARQLRETALGVLRVDLALETGDDFVVKRPADLVPTLAAEVELVERALASRPEIAAAEQAVELARLEREVRAGERRPALQAEGTFTQQRGNFPAERFGAVALGFSVPIYQGGRLAARRAVAEEQERQARLALGELRLVVREQVHRLLVDLHTADTDEQLAGELLAAVEAEYEEISSLYEALESTSLDVATAELSLAEARRAVVNSSLDRDLAEVRVLHAAGGLLDAFDHRLSREPEP